MNPRRSEAHDHNRYRSGCRCAACRESWRRYTERHRLRRIAAGQCYDCTATPLPGHRRCPRHELAIATRRRRERATRSA